MASGSEVLSQSDVLENDQSDIGDVSWEVTLIERTCEGVSTY